MPLDTHFQTDNHFRVGNQGDTAISRTAAGTLAVGSGLYGAVDGTTIAATDICQSPFGAKAVTGVNEELITLGTGALTTDSVGNLLPAGAIILAVVARVVTTITTSASWAVGDATTAARFISADTTLTAGEVQVGLNHASGAVTTLAAGPTQASAAKVRITMGTSNPGAGQIRVTVYYQQFTAATS